MMGCRFEGPFTSNGQPIQVRHSADGRSRILSRTYFPKDLRHTGCSTTAPRRRSGRRSSESSTCLARMTYRMTLFLTVGPQYGKVGVYLNNRWMTNINAYNETFLPAKRIRASGNGYSHDGSARTNLKFVILGQDVNATGMDFGLVAMHCSPMGAINVRKWQVIGPVAVPGKGRLGSCQSSREGTGPR